MATRAILVEKVLKAANGGTISTNMRFSRNQIAYELNAVLAKLLKVQVYDGFKDGRSTAGGAMIATYEGVLIDRRDKGRCSAKLPVTPMQMPNGIDVYRVYPSGYPEKEYIPIESGLLYTIVGSKVLSPLGPQCYEYRGGRVWINDDAIGNGVDKLDMELCVADIMAKDASGNYLVGDNEPLPIPPDVEYDAEIAVLQVLGVMPTTNRADDKIASPTKADVR